MQKKGRRVAENINCERDLSIGKGEERERERESTVPSSIEQILSINGWLTGERWHR